MGIVEIPATTKCIRGCCTSSSIRLDLSRGEFHTGKLLASGSESDVFSGEFQGLPAAVKRPRLTKREDTDRFHSELRLLCTLQHRSLVGILGARAHPPDYAMVFKLYKGGSLFDALHIRGWEPNLAEALAVAINLGEALEYMHSQGIVHRDVKPANILLDEQGHAVLTDLGLAASADFLSEQAKDVWVNQGKPTGGFKKSRIIGTTQYMAPEVLRGNGHSMASDVYSFGITANELLTRVVPFADCTTAAQPHTVLEMAYTEQQLIAGITAGSLRPVLYQPPTSPALVNGNATLEQHQANGASSLTGDWISSLPGIISSCWGEDPLSRPTMAPLVSALRSLLQACLQEMGVHEGAEFRGPLWWLRTDGSQPIRESAPPTLPAAAGTESTQVNAGAAEGQGLLAQLQAGVYRPELTGGWLASVGGRESMEDAHFQAVLAYSPVAPGGVSSSPGAGRGEGGTMGGALPAGWVLGRGMEGVAKVDSAMGVAGESGGDTSSGVPHIFMFGVFDGHRGPEAAEYAVSHLPTIVAKHLIRSSSCALAIKAAFQEADSALNQALKEGRAQQLRLRGEGVAESSGGGRTMKQHFPGCTAAMSVIVGDKLYVANAGDCRTVLCRGGKAVALSEDHVASNDKERRRLLEAGASVAWRVNTWRVGDAGIEVSRSLGDHDLKPAVTAEPEVTCHTLGPEDEFLVMATDGLWGVVSNEEAVSMLKETVKEPGMAAKRLAIAAGERGSTDNITVLVLFLKQVDTLERIF